MKKPSSASTVSPSNSQTGELDMEALTFNEKTYYVGFDAKQGAELQGEMIVNYLQSKCAELDRNGDGIAAVAEAAVLSLSSNANMKLQTVKRKVMSNFPPERPITVSISTQEEIASSWQ